MKHRLCHVSKKRTVGCGIAIALCAVLAACKTSPPSQPAAQTRAPDQAAEFQPAYPISAITFELGSYPELFSSECYAVWISPDVAEQKRAEDVERGFTPDPWIQEDALSILHDFIVIECHTESVFGDMSIAYDVVGLRGVTAFLETPDGRRINPIQRIIGAPVEEEQRGALKAFRRSNILVFPRRDLWSGSLTLDPSLIAMKLVLESHNSRFAFQWPDLRYADPTAVSAQPDRFRLLKVGFTELFESVRRLNQITQ